eukprot:1060401-Pleurochrysis_carterae.AAC.1
MESSTEVKGMRETSNEKIAPDWRSMIQLQRSARLSCTPAFMLRVTNHLGYVFRRDDVFDERNGYGGVCELQDGTDSFRLDVPQNSLEHIFEHMSRLRDKLDPRASHEIEDRGRSRED